MLKIKNTKSGFTLIEVILVVVILAIAVGLSLLYLQSSALRADLNGQTSQLVSYLRLAHSNAASGVNNSSHGVHLEDHSYTTFLGDTFNEEALNNFETELPEVITINNINLNGGGTDIIFTQPKGETLKYGTFDISSENLNKTVTITITKIGTINY